MYDCEISYFHNDRINILTMPDKWEFENEEIRVTWEKIVCIHSGVCAQKLSSVFKPGQKPWVQLDGANKESVMETIRQCPSAALKYELKGE